MKETVMKSFKIRSCCLAMGMAWWAIPASSHGQRMEFGIHHTAASWFCFYAIQEAPILSAEMRTPHDELVRFEEYHGEFEAISRQGLTLDELNTEITGAYALYVRLGSGISTYQFTINSASADWMPPLPVLNPVQEPISPNAQFSWSWSGRGDAKAFEFFQWNTDWTPAGHEGQFFTWSHEPGFEDLSQSVSLLPVPGFVTVRVTYWNLFEGNGWLTDWQYLGGGGDVLGDNLFLYGASYDEMTVQVIPEPLTVLHGALGLLTLKMVRALRRRPLRRGLA